MPEEEQRTEGIDGGQDLPDEQVYVYFCGWCGHAVAGFSGNGSEPDDFFAMRLHAKDHFEEIGSGYNTDLMRGEFFLDLEDRADIEYLKKFFPELSDGTKKKSYATIDLSECTVSPVIARLLKKEEVELVPEETNTGNVVKRYRKKE